MTLEEGTWAAWLYDVLKPRVQEIVVCNPRHNADTVLESRSVLDLLVQAKPIVDLSDLLWTGKGQSEPQRIFRSSSRN